MAQEFKKWLRYGDRETKKKDRETNRRNPQCGWNREIPQEAEKRTAGRNAHISKLTTKTFKGTNNRILENIWLYIMRNTRSTDDNPI